MLERQYLLPGRPAKPVLLTEEELTEVHSQYGTYGQP